MTNKEFKQEYDKLVSVYPEHFENKFKENAIAKHVSGLDHKWWAALVNRMILSSNPRLDIEDAARGERLARQRFRSTKELLQAQDAFSKNISKSGLENFLKDRGVNSLAEAIKAPPEKDKAQ